MDVMKTRIMTSAIPDQSTGGKILHMSLRQAAHEIVSKNGWKGLFTGAVPRSVWWFGVCGIFFPCYEETKASLHRYHAVKHGHVEPNYMTQSAEA